MSSYAELLQTCTEFQQNFAVLNGKYSALVQLHRNETDRGEQLQKKVEAAAVREEQYEEQLRSLRKDLETAAGYKEKFLAATVALEQTKARVQSTRRDVEDAATEHAYEVEQLQQRLRDLTARVEVVTNGGRVRELSQQVATLEESAAAAAAALREEKERASQEVLLAHDAVREQQARIAELEQRCRALEMETTELRSAMRRSADLQNDGAMLKERHATEAAMAQREAAQLRQDLSALRSQLEEQTVAQEEELQAARRACEAEKSALRAQLATASEALAEATEAADTQRQRLTDGERTTQQRIDAARDEATAELTGVRRLLSQAREERQHADERCAALRREREESERAAAAGRAEQVALRERLAQSQCQLTAAAQQEAWLSAELTHANEQLAAAQRRATELTSALQQQEQLSVELGRAQLRAAVAEEELQDSRRVADEANVRAQSVEEAAARRLHDRKKELRACDKQLRVERATSDGLRKKLLQAVAEREADRYCCTGRARSVAAEQGSRTGESMEPSASAACDVVALLKQQSTQADQLRSRLLELVR